jgi:hypothetical protein
MSWKWLSLLVVLTLPTAAGAETRRVCDTRVDWTYAKPAPDVPAKYQKLLGLWTGAAHFSGSSESAHMCIAVAIQEVKADGRTDSMLAWNLGDGNESPNQVSKGLANWWAQTVFLFPHKAEQLIFAGNAPYRGRWYRYVLDFPTESDPDTIRGFLYASRQCSATDPSPAAWNNVVEAHKVTLKRQKDSYLPFSIPTN